MRLLIRGLFVCGFGILNIDEGGRFFFFLDIVFLKSLNSIYVFIVYNLKKKIICNC